MNLPIQCEPIQRTIAAQSSVDRSSLTGGGVIGASEFGVGPSEFGVEPSAWWEDLIKVGTPILGGLLGGI